MTILRSEVSRLTAFKNLQADDFEAVSWFLPAGFLIREVEVGVTEVDGSVALVRVEMRFGASHPASQGEFQTFHDRAFAAESSAGSFSAPSALQTVIAAAATTLQGRGRFSIGRRVDPARQYFVVGMASESSEANAYVSVFGEASH